MGLHCHAAQNSDPLSIALFEAIRSQNYSIAEKFIEQGARITDPLLGAQAVEKLGTAIVFEQQHLALLYIRALSKNALKFLYCPLVCEEDFCWRPEAQSLLQLAERGGDQLIINALKSAGVTLTDEEIKTRERKSFYETLNTQGCDAALARVEEVVRPLLGCSHDGLKQVLDLHRKCGRDFLSKLFAITGFNRDQALEFMLQRYYKSDEMAIFLKAGDHLPEVNTLHTVIAKQMADGVFDFELLSNVPQEAIPSHAIERAIMAERIDVINFLIGKGAGLTSYHCDDIVAEAIRRNLSGVPSTLLKAGAPATGAALSELHRLYPEDAKQLLIELLQKGADVTTTALISVTQFPAPYAQDFLNLLIAARDNKLDDLSSQQKASLLTWAISNDMVLFQKLADLYKN